MAMMHATRWRRIGRVPMGAVNWWRKNALALPGRDVPSLFPTGGVEGVRAIYPELLTWGWVNKRCLPACLAGRDVREPRHAA